MQHVYILILNYRSGQEVEELLETVFRSTYKAFTVIVIDNFSQDDSIEQLKYWADHETDFNDPLFSSSKELLAKPVLYEYLTCDVFTALQNIEALPQLVFVQNGRNEGFAGGLNRVIEKLCRQDAYLWLLNPDMTVREDSLGELVAFANSTPRQSIIGPVVKYHNDPERVHFYGGGRVNTNSATISLIDSIDKTAGLDYISGGALFTHAASFSELGLLPENYFLYWEETDWCYRAKSQGYSLLVCRTAICFDKVSTTIGKGFIADYYYTRNGLQYLAKYCKKNIPIALFYVTIRIVKRIVTGRWKRAWGVINGLMAFFKNDRYAIK